MLLSFAKPSISNLCQHTKKGVVKTTPGTIISSPPILFLTIFFHFRDKLLGAIAIVTNLFSQLFPLAVQDNQGRKTFDVIFFFQRFIGLLLCRGQFLVMRKISFN